MSDVLAIIPARVGSKGIPNKNFRPLVGVAPVERAARVAQAVPLPVVITSDADVLDGIAGWTASPGPVTWLHAPAPLHTDTCAMIDVIQDVLARVPGPPEQIVVLLQPTQPLREPKHVTAAIALLASSGADSVVSVVELPRTHHPRWQFEVHDGQLHHALGPPLHLLPTRRQDLSATYIREGTCYAFRRALIARDGDIYGYDTRALIIPPEETCPLDTPADWAEAERRLLARG